MKIPSSFTLGGHTFTVEMISGSRLKKLAGQEALGLTIFQELKVYVHNPTRSVSRSVVEQTFWHEYGHCILWVMGHQDYDNEDVVDRFGHLMKQYHDTVQYGTT
jgi:hypothetical protein